jgi:hypothetical protein
VDVLDMRSTCRGGFADIHHTPIRKRVGKRLADDYQWTVPISWLPLNSSFVSGGAISDIVGARLLKPEA